MTARTHARTLTLCAATVSTVAVPAIASAATGTSAVSIKPVSVPRHQYSAAVQTTTVRHTATVQTASVSVTPASDTTETVKTYRVKAGDTLFGIAAKSLGSGYLYPKIFQLNSGRVESGGQRFTNANLIEIGWTIDLPSGAAATADREQATTTTTTTATTTAPPATTDSTTTQSSSQGSSSSQSSTQDSSQSSAQSSTQSSTGDSSSSGYADDLDGWINQAISILSANGYSVSYNAIYETAINESAGNPDAVNDWDSNAAAGTPSTGLMQMIQPTFDAYALSGYDDIDNPVDNIIAAVRYAAAEYGSLDNVVAARCGGSCWYGY
jgi:LysM repeat protein